MKLGEINLKWVEIKMPELDLAKLIIHFAHSNTAEGKSPKTVSWYSEMLSDFVRFMTPNGKHAILAKFHVGQLSESSSSVSRRDRSLHIPSKAKFGLSRPSTLGSMPKAISPTTCSPDSSCPKLRKRWWSP